MEFTRHWHRADFDQLDKLYRVNLVNSLSGFKSANLIGTVDAAGNANLAMFSSLVHLGANPPLVAFINRPDSVERHTLDNILATGWFTVNQVNNAIWQQSHQTSARYPREVSEFDATGLHTAPCPVCPAPFVAESRLRYACRLVEHQTLRVNGTVMVIGEIEYLETDEAAIAKDGYIDIERLGTVAVSGLDSYHRTRRLDRLQYAKPDRPVRPLGSAGNRD
ncbi:flavin reductase family protein [Microbulbifer sediminum]|uniref:flavin reductase family protein n=1 Tax=Microbulbifer sediminum TaxID=2904250 RepID=UPI001F2510DF|nr:flavin reductase family protein [Microbulbifer sediminum]